jgi:CheY-like chemotaxis protein
MTILLVEDNPADAVLVAEAFEEARFDCAITVVHDGEQAVAFLDALDADASQDCPDLILLDLNLPKVSGTAVLERLRASPRCAEIKVLIVSSSDAPADRQKAMTLGASDYFRKPSSLKEFMLLGAKVKSMLV